MLLHHYTSRQLFPRIMKEGITLGVVPWVMKDDGKVRMMGPLQWLTASPDFDEQEPWSIPQLFAAHRMRKTDYRITLAIPNLATCNVISWLAFARMHQLPVGEYFATIKGHEHWHIYRGKIPVEWIVESVCNPIRYAPELIIDPT